MEPDRKLVLGDFQQFSKVIETSEVFLLRMLCMHHQSSEHRIILDIIPCQDTDTIYSPNPRCLLSSSVSRLGMMLGGEADYLNASEGS